MSFYSMFFINCIKIESLAATALGKPDAIAEL